MTATTNDVNVTVTDEAYEELSSFMENEESVGKSIRIMIAGFGCSGPNIGLALDDPNEEDTVFTKGNVSLLADTSMQLHIVQGEGLNIEAVDIPGRDQKGFRLSLNKEAPHSCGSGCSGC